MNAILLLLLFVAVCGVAGAIVGALAGAFLSGLARAIRDDARRER